MLEILRQFSDNQLAVLACLGAGGLSMLLLTISYHSNPANRSSQRMRIPQQPENPAQAGRSDRQAA